MMMRFFYLTLVPLLFGMLGGFWVQVHSDEVTPIAILDRSALFKALDQGDPESQHRRLQFEHAAQMLKEQGYLVIDKGWVLSAPEELYVDLD